MPSANPHLDFWTFAEHYDTFIESEFRLPLQFSGSEIQPHPYRDGLWLKRDDLTELGSHKLRSMLYRFSLGAQLGEKKYVISSSGNAALSAIFCAAQLPEIQLVVLLSEKTADYKLKSMQEHAKAYPNIHLIFSKRPMRLCNYLAAKYGYTNLRPSLDPHAPVGFQSLGYEIDQQFPKVEHMVTFMTSGASFLGLAQAYQKLEGNSMPRLHAVMCPEHPENLGVRRSHLFPQVEEQARATKGAVHEVSLNQLKSEHQELFLQGYEVSWESAGTLAFAKDLVQQGAKNVVAITTGYEPSKKMSSNDGPNDFTDWPIIDDLKAMDAWLSLFD